MALKEALREGRAGAARADHGARGDACPTTAVGAVNGDLNSRRGRLHGMEPVGGMTRSRPRCRWRRCSPTRSLSSMTGGRGDYSMHFLRYEEVPAHVAQKVVEAAAEEASRRLSAAAAGPAPSASAAEAVVTLRDPMARTRDIRTNQQDISCDVCGRTLLRGERAEPFLAGGERRQVCELCTARAQHEGWIREWRRRRAGAARLAPRGPDAPGRPAPRPPRARPRGRRRAGGPGRRRARHALRQPARAPGRAAVRAASRRASRAASARCRRTPSSRWSARSTSSTPSEHVRTVGGVARSLGAAGGRRPPACRPAERGRRSRSMWELSWYRFEVDLSDEGSGVRREGQGTELSRAGRRASRPSTRPPTSAARCIWRPADRVLSLSA